MNRFDISVCTKSKCTAKGIQVKLWAADAQADSY